MAPTLVTDPPTLAARDPDGHKGNYGRVLIVGGSRGMAGAAALAGMSALRGGAGLVTVACPESVAAIVAGFEPSLMTMPLPADDAGRLAESAIAPILERKADVMALGPGMSQSDLLDRLVEAVVVGFEGPLIVDADALNSISRQVDCLCARKAPTILTPHVAEFARLTGISITAIQENRLAAASSFADQTGVVVVLKGRNTVVTDGAKAFVNPTGNPGMATGGTGDVLTGLIAALLGQKLLPFEAARLGAYLHGRAGDIAAAQGSPVSLIASDLLRAFPQAFRSLEARAAETS